MDTPDIFNSNTIATDGGLIYPRLYVSLYPKTKFIEDFRPDYFIKREEFDSLLLEVYNTVGISLYRSYMSGKCFDVRLIEEAKTLMFVSFVSAENIAESKYKWTGKDLEFADKVGDLADLQDKLDTLKASDYNSRPIAPLLTEDKLTQAMLESMYYPIEELDRATSFCVKYDLLKFDRVALRPATSKNKTKIGFKPTHND